MSDRLLDKLTRRGESLDRVHHELERDDSEDFGCFGWLRGVRDRAPMLELRKRDGRCLAVGYGWIERMEYDPDLGITLHLHGRSVRIQGHGLNLDLGPDRARGVRLFEGLTRHRVSWVRELDRNPSPARVEIEIAVEQVNWD
ncbi:MAG: hypothetical protein AB7Q00_12665 [Phycisphaerales bacterium]